MAGQREKIFLATKFCTPHGHLPAGSSVADYVAAVEASLERLQTSYVDLVHVHACDDTRRLADPNLHEAFRQLSEAGKARFLGVSTHTPNLEQVANHAIADGRFDVLMLAYHHGSFPHLPEIIARAHAADLGVVAMKTLKGAKHKELAEFRDAADSYAQAAFKWVLSNPNVSCLVISFWAHAQLDEYLVASGQPPSAGDAGVLRRYDELIAGKHCFAHCGACLDRAPRISRSTTCCGTACTSRTTASRRTRCRSTRSSRSRRTCASAARRRASALPARRADPGAHERRAPTPHARLRIAAEEPR